MAFRADEPPAISIGMGTHVVTVGLTNGIKCAKTLYVLEVLFPACNSSVKISILLLYRSIFGGTRDRAFEYALRTLAALWLILGVVGTSCTALQCWPVSYAWTTDHTQQCLNLEKMVMSLTIFSVILNFATLLLPLPLIWKLHLSRKTRLSVAALFVLGGGYALFANDCTHTC